MPTMTRGAQTRVESACAKWGPPCVRRWCVRSSLPVWEPWCRRASAAPSAWLQIRSKQVGSRARSHLCPLPQPLAGRWAARSTRRSTSTTTSGSRTPAASAPATTASPSATRSSASRCQTARRRRSPRASAAPCVSRPPVPARWKVGVQVYSLS